MSLIARGTCPDPELVTSLVDGELDPTTRDALLSHLGGCAECRAVVEAERSASAALRGLGDPVPSPALLARLTELPALVPAPESTVGIPAFGEALTRDEPVSLDERRRRLQARHASAYVGAAASVAVFMVGAFAFVGATAGPDAPAGTTAVVPAADLLTMEHAVTTVQTSLGGPGFSTVSVSMPDVAPPAVAR